MTKVSTLIRQMAKEGHKLASLERASVLAASDDPKDQDKAREIRVRHDYENLKKQIGSKKKPTKPVIEGSAYGLWKGDGKRKLPGDKKKKEDVKEAKVDKGRSDYGKATIRNWRHSGPSTVEPAMFDPENKRGKTIEKRREEHKARRGVKGAKVPTYKKEEVEVVSELKTSTLRNYVNKASIEAVGRGVDAGIKGMTGTKDEMEKNMTKAYKRQRGINRAANKLASRAERKEEVELDERLGGKGYKPYTSLTGKKVSGDWEDSDRGAGNKAKKRAGGKVEKKSPTYRAYVLNKEEVEIDEGKKKGLWDRIRAKRERIKAGSGEKKAKPGDKDYPKTLNVEGLEKARKNVGADKCWDGYKAKGTKKKGGKEVPNCVKVDEGAAWTKKAGKNPEGGLNEKGRKSYERENPGSDLKAPQPEGGSRKKSFCARMGGMKKKLTSSKTANDPDSRINKALRKWKCNETVAGGVPLTPQELEIQKKMSRLNVRLARKRSQEMQKAKIQDTETAPEQVKEEDKAFNTVVAALRKKHGKDAVITKTSKPKPPSEAQKKKAAAERKKRQDAENKAYAARAKKAGFKSTQDYTDVVARYGSEDNYRKGKGLGT